MPLDLHLKDSVLIILSIVTVSMRWFGIQSIWSNVGIDNSDFFLHCKD